MTTARPSRDSGAASVVLILATTLCLALAAAAVVAVADLAATSARARTAADAAALAAAGTSPLVAAPSSRRFDPVGEARRVAAGNGARLVRTDDRRWPLRITVTVEIDPATRWVHRAVGAITASATAGVRPRARAGGPQG